jgi:adhesin transport system membrane fusion protein
MKLIKRKDSSSVRDVDIPFMRDLSEALHAQSTPGASWSLYLLGLVIFTAVIWATFARVEEITQGQGRVIPVSREQIISSLEGGLLEELKVSEGAVVEKGQVLLRLDPTRFAAQYREGVSKALGLKAAVARLRAEAYGQALQFPPEVEAAKRIVRDETQAYEQRRKALEEGLAAVQQSLTLAEKEIAMSERLANKGLLSDVELLRMKRQANDLRLQMIERRNRFRAEANAELVRLESELAQTKENVVARQDTMDRTVIRAPVKGTVKNIRFTTIGGVIPQGSDILEIVPLEEQLLVEAKIRPSDVAFLHPGLPAMVKISAYDFSIYGGLSGTVEHISPDTLREDTRTTPSQEPTYYRVLVRTQHSVLAAGGRNLPIIPGMTASVEIKTGEKTVMSYLLKPVFKAKEAFRER